jgi:hypothetical protein
MYIGGHLNTVASRDLCLYIKDFWMICADWHNAEKPVLNNITMQSRERHFAVSSYARSVLIPGICYICECQYLYVQFSTIVVQDVSPWCFREYLIRIMIMLYTECGSIWSVIWYHSRQLHMSLLWILWAKICDAGYILRTKSLIYSCFLYSAISSLIKHMQPVYTYMLRINRLLSL